jgi:hypothetical protein
MSVRRFARENGLTLAFLGLFLAVLFAESFAGLADFNQQQVSNGGEAVSYLRYITSSSFAADVSENWQSEYLQFFLFIVATVWLVQRGSPESKDLDSVGLESDEEQKLGVHTEDDSPEWARAGGFRTMLYGQSLGWLMGILFLLCWLAQSVTGEAAYNAQQLQQLQDPVTWTQYVTAPDFWNRTVQNWQSELLAVASTVAFSIYLRQRGSPESKPVGAPHAATSVEG